MFAEFFTALRLKRKSSAFYDEDEGDDPFSDDDEGPPENVDGFILPQDAESMTFYSAEWRRKSLFHATRGSIGLAWSIFSLRGTPNKENWPVSTLRTNNLTLFDTPIRTSTIYLTPTRLYSRKQVQWICAHFCQTYHPHRILFCP